MKSILQHTNGILNIFFVILYLQKARNGSVFGSTMCIKESKLGKERYAKPKDKLKKECDVQ